MSPGMPKPASDLAAGEVLDMLTVLSSLQLCQLKQERDEWQRMALQYKEAFEFQTRQLQQFQDICFATQAELENERLLKRSESTKANVNQRSDSSYMTSSRAVHSSVDFLEHSELKLFPNPPPSFELKDVDHLLGKQQHRRALNKLDDLLRGSLSAEARVEALLFKSVILRESGSEWLYDALAQCSEALELCDRLSELEAYLPRIQYQRGLCYYRLSMGSKAQAVFIAANDSDSCSDTASEYIKICEEVDQNSKRRSAFDEERNHLEDYLSHWKDRRQAY